MLQAHNFKVQLCEEKQGNKFQDLCITNQKIFKKSLFKDITFFQQKCIEKQRFFISVKFLFKKFNFLQQKCIEKKGFFISVKCLAKVYEGKKCTHNFFCTIKIPYQASINFLNKRTKQSNIWGKKAEHKQNDQIFKIYIYYTLITYKGTPFFFLSQRNQKSKLQLTFSHHLHTGTWL